MVRFSFSCIYRHPLKGPTIQASLNGAKQSLIIALYFTSTFSSELHKSAHVSWPSFTSSCSLQRHICLGHLPLHFNMFSSTAHMSWPLASLLHFYMFSSTVHASWPSFSSTCSLPLQMCLDHPSFLHNLFNCKF